MNPTRLVKPGLLPRLSTFRPQVLLAAIALLALPASAAEKAYRYYQFKTTKLVGNGSNVMLSEFDFYHNNVKLNIRNKTGVGASIPCEATAGVNSTDPADGVPNNLLDGLVETKLVRRSGLVAGNEIVFDFGATTPHPVLDSYSFTTATDGSGFVRTPQSWFLSGSDDKVNWTPLTWEVDKVTVLENSTTYGPFGIPEIIPPLINSFSTPLQIVLNNTPITFSYNTQFSTARNVLAGATTIPLSAESGTFVVTPPANSQAADYTLVATKDPELSASKTVLVRSVAGGPSTYQYVRFKITKRRGGAADNTVQLAEFEFYNSAVSSAKIPITGVTNPGGNNPGAETPDKIIDGVTTEAGNKWLDFNNAALVFDLGSQKTFNQYAFFTGGDAEDRDPIQWTLEGSNDQERWNLIENVNFDYMPPSARNTTTTPIPLPGPSLPPQIEFFTADATTLLTGQSVTLSWSTQATSAVSITPAPGAGQALFGSVTLTPTASTVYTLTATPPGSINAPITQTISIAVVADPGKTEVDYDDFANAGAELVKVGTTTVVPPGGPFSGRLRLTNDENSQRGAAWFLNKLNTTVGFETNFGLSMNSVPTNNSPADGIAFVVHNSPLRNAELGTGETGVTQNSLNVTFRSFGYNPQDASRIQVSIGTIVLASTTAYTTPGVELYGIPGVDDQGNIITTGGLPYTLGTMTTDPAYRIRIVYVPGDLDVYLDGIAVIQNVEVYLEGSAADESGKSYFGFTARTGGNTQFNDITDWSVKTGNFTKTLPFGTVKNLFRYNVGTSKPAGVDLVWNAEETATYEVLSSPNLVDWTPVKDLTNAAGPLGDSETGVIPGLNGQIGATVTIPPAGGDKLFYRVKSSK
jgi:hypothetical protein